MTGKFWMNCLSSSCPSGMLGETRGWFERPSMSDRRYPAFAEPSTRERNAGRRTLTERRTTALLAPAPPLHGRAAGGRIPLFRTVFIFAGFSSYSRSSCLWDGPRLRAGQLAALATPSRRRMLRCCRSIRSSIGYPHATTRGNPGCGLARRHRRVGLCSVLGHAGQVRSAGAPRSRDRNPSHCARPPHGWIRIPALCGGFHCGATRARLALPTIARLPKTIGA